MNEFLRANESLTDEELLICEEATRLWEESHDEESHDEEREN